MKYVMGLSRCSTSRLERPPCLPPLNIHQSRTIQSWVEKPSLQPRLQHPLRTFCLSVLYLFTHLLSSALWWILATPRVQSLLHWLRSVRFAFPPSLSFPPFLFSPSLPTPKSSYMIQGVALYHQLTDFFLIVHGHTTQGV